MNKINKKLVSLLGAGAFFCLSLTGCTSREAVSPAVKLEGEVRGMFVHTAQNRDFPSEPGLPYSQVRSEIDSLVDFAKSTQLNTLFFEVRPQSDAVYLSDLFPVSDVWMKKQGAFTTDDPLADLVGRAAGERIQVFGVINPFYVGESLETLGRKNPALRQQNELVKLEDGYYWDISAPRARKTIIDGILEVSTWYGISGITLHQIDSPMLMAQPDYVENLKLFLQELAAAIVEKSPDRQLSLSINGNTFSPDLCRELSQAVAMDMVLPTLTDESSLGGESYEALLQRWYQAFVGTGVSLVPVHNTGAVTAPAGQTPLYADPYEINYQLYQSNLTGVLGSAIDSYSSARQSPHGVASLMTALYQGGDIFGENAQLEIQPGFSITRPQTSLTTTSATYFVTGISNPARPLLLDGKEVPRNTQSGLFGVLVNLEYGKNTLRFTQPAEEETELEEELIVLSIQRNRPTSGPQLISQITPSSIYPTGPTAVRVGEEFTLRCVAPGGARVTATIAGKTIALTQVSPTQAGVAATYTGTATLNGDYAIKEVQKLGPLTYYLTANGKTTSYTSQGELYVAGEEANIVVQVEDYIAGILYSMDSNDIQGTPYEAVGGFIGSLVQGAKDYVVEDAGTHFKLKSGGYLSKSAASILEGEQTLETTVDSVAFQQNAKQETYTISGAVGAPHHAQMTDTGLTITLYNTKSEQQASIQTDSSLFSSITQTPDQDDSTTFTFTLAQGQSLWGYDVNYEGESLVITCRKKPTLSPIYGKPLTGVTVVLDPGHGGMDPGAPGVAAGIGPDEATMNLAATHALQKSLENLGATVVLTSSFITQPEEQLLSLFERMEIARKNEADFFISMHHNSVAETSNANTASGVEIYYNTLSSQSLSEDVAARLSGAANRKNKGAEQSYYVVTKVTFCPAILTEIGYIANPAEYEALLDPYTLYRSSNAIAAAVVDQLIPPPISEEILVEESSQA